VYLLFNSAFRPTYLENVFCFLCFPKGATVTMRFSSKNVPENLSNPIGKECLIIYIDRFNPGRYKYIPVRFGKITNTRTEFFDHTVRSFYDIELGDFCNLNAGSVDEDFYQQLEKKHPTTPKLQNHDPENTNDGHYIYEIEDSETNRNIESTDKSWSILVQALSKTKALKDKDIVFYKSQITNGKNKQILKCDSGKTYYFEFTYYNPKDLSHNINIDFLPPLLSPGQATVKIGCGMDKVIFPFSVDKVYQCNSWTKIVIKESSLENQKSFNIKLSPVFLNKGNIILIVLFAIVLCAPFLLQFFDIVPQTTFDNKLLSMFVELLKWGVGFTLFVRIGKPVS